MSFAGALTSDNIQDSRTFLFANTTDAQTKLQRNSEGIPGGVVMQNMDDYLVPTKVLLWFVSGDNVLLTSWFPVSQLS